jgi:hypothetical protein
MSEKWRVAIFRATLAPRITENPSISRMVGCFPRLESSRAVAPLAVHRFSPQPPVVSRNRPRRAPRSAHVELNLQNPEQKLAWIPEREKRAAWTRRELANKTKQR